MQWWHTTQMTYCTNDILHQWQTAPMTDCINDRLHNFFSCTSDILHSCQFNLHVTWLLLRNEKSAYMEFIPHNHYRTVYLYFSVFQLVITHCFSIFGSRLGARRIFDTFWENKFCKKKFWKIKLWKKKLKKWVYR